MYSIGEKVRVTLAPGRACKGLILCIGSSNKNEERTYDVLLEPGSSSKIEPTLNGGDGSHAGEPSREIPGLVESDLSPLQPFEIDGCIEGPPSRALPTAERTALAEGLKEKGNVLFKLGDMEAAADFFEAVLTMLEPSPTVGATVLVRVPAGVNPAESGAGHFRPAMIAGADAEGRSYDVIFDNTETTSGRGGGGDETQYGGEEEDDEEDGVRADRIVSLSLAPCVSCAARLNLARCRFKGGRHTEVVEMCTVVISLAKLAISDKERPRDEKVKLRGHCLTALRVRGSSHLARNHVGLARKDARTMARSVWDTESRAQASRFDAEVEKKAKALLKANRKLAKDVTRWVDASMAKHEEASSGREDGHDLPSTRSDTGQGCDDGKGESVEGEGGVEESKGGERASTVDGEQKSWLGSWFR